MTTSSRFGYELQLSLFDTMGCNDDFSRREDMYPFVAPLADLSALPKHAPENYLYIGINAFIAPFGDVILILCRDV